MQSYGCRMRRPSMLVFLCFPYLQQCLSARKLVSDPHMLCLCSCLIPRSLLLCAQSFCKACSYLKMTIPHSPPNIHFLMMYGPICILFLLPLICKEHIWRKKKHLSLLIRCRAVPYTLKIQNQCFEK